MSLFELVNFWSQASGIEEHFGCTALLVTDIDDRGYDCIIVGNFEGILRIFTASADPEEDADLSFRAHDLLLEVELECPILQVAAGKFIGKSQNTQLAILHPRNVAVYTFTDVPGNVTHGHQFALKQMYAHDLKHSAYQLIVGPFGRVENRDSFCILALDGTLTFFDQHICVAETKFPEFLLPNPFAYIAIEDIFVTLSGNWYLEAYRYEALIESKNAAAKSIWRVNIGEMMISIQCVEHYNDSKIVALSTRNLNCFLANGTTLFAKRLQHTPLCCHAFINSETNKVTTLLATDANMLQVYVEHTICWVAKIYSTPICISMANIKCVKGAIVVLDKEGNLSCGYLGTEPSPFVSPALDNSVVNYRNNEEKLELLEREIEKECTDFTKLPLAREVNIEFDLEGVTIENCVLVVKLNASSVINDANLSLVAVKPLDVSPKNYSLVTLGETVSLRFAVSVNAVEAAFPISSLEITAFLTYLSNVTRIPIVIRKMYEIPLKLIAQTCQQPMSEPNIAILLDCDQPTLPLTSIFKEFSGTQWTSSSCTDELVTFSYRLDASQYCSVTVLRNQRTYEFKSNHSGIVNLIAKKLIASCEKLYVKKDPKGVKFNCNAMPLASLWSAIETRVTIRKEIFNLKKELEEHGCQLRIIQRRLLMKMKDVVKSQLEPLRLLFDENLNAIDELTKKIEINEKVLNETNCDLNGCINFFLLLLEYNSSMNIDHLPMIRAAISNPFHCSHDQGWEEVTELSVLHLLQQVYSVQKMNEVREIAQDENYVTCTLRIKSLIEMLIDCAFKGNYRTSEAPRSINTIMEGEEQDEFSYFHENTLPNE